jgi:hypothetical protein
VKKKPFTTDRDPTPAINKWDLTRREIEVLDLLRTGASDKEIASARRRPLNGEQARREYPEENEGHQPDRGGEFELAAIDTQFSPFHGLTWDDGHLPIALQQWHICASKPETLRRIQPIGSYSVSTRLNGGTQRKIGSPVSNRASSSNLYSMGGRE